VERAARRALALLACTQFLLILDTAIINVAAPSIGDELTISPSSLSWVANAYLGGLAVLLLAVFVVEARVRVPLVPLSVLRRPALVRATVSDGDRICGLVAGLSWQSLLSADGSFVADMLFPSLVLGGDCRW
jgi:MFS family permease